MNYTVQVFNTKNKQIGSVTFFSLSSAETYADNLIQQSIPHKLLINGKIYSEYEI